jgi:hypothetical protein
VLLDFETGFFQHLIGLAKSQKFDGVYASVRTPTGADGLLAAFKLRWQNDQGDPLTEKFVSLFGSPSGQIKSNPPFVAEWLVSQPESVPPPSIDREQRDAMFDMLIKEANRQLAAESTRFKHPNGLVDLAAADCRAIGR